MIRTENLTRIFRTEEVETIALNGVNIEVEDGEFIAIMGPSGCGKSTLLNILGLLDSPTEGKYWLNNEEVGHLKERERTAYRKGRIGFVFQNYRETHCNYYAVLGMLAKVYWMKGDMENAGKYAQMVIDSQKFPLAEPSEIKDLFAGKLSPKETLWGIYSNTYNETANGYLYKYQSYFSYDPYTDDSGATHLLPYDKVYAKDVTGIDQDFRKNWFKKGTGNVRCLKTVDYYTIEENQNVPKDWVTRIPGINMLHVSELYIIAAEALLETNYAKALEYYNAETSSRGLPALKGDVKLTKDMIFNEYHKEMFGEGQVWYNMKRLNKDIISNLDSKTIPASEDIYVIPIPQDEFNYRD